MNRIKFEDSFKFNKNIEINFKAIEITKDHIDYFLKGSDVRILNNMEFVTYYVGDK